MDRYYQGGDIFHLEPALSETFDKFRTEVISALNYCITINKASPVIFLFSFCFISTSMKRVKGILERKATWSLRGDEIHTTHVLWRVRLLPFAPLGVSRDNTHTDAKHPARSSPRARAQTRRRNIYLRTRHFAIGNDGDGPKSPLV